MLEKDHTEMQACSPTTNRVILRAFCLSAVACRSLNELHASDESCRALHSQVLPWLVKMGAQDELESWESSLIDLPLGKLKNQQRTNATWTIEGLAVLGWSLNRFELPSHDDCVNPQALVSVLHFLQPAAAAAFTNATLRPTEEIRLRANLAFAIHWRLTDFSLRPRRMDFSKFLRTAPWFGPIKIEDLPLAKSDLSIAGVPISKAADDDLRIARSIACERQRAFNWLLGDHTTYSKADAST